MVITTPASSVNTCFIGWIWSLKATENSRKKLASAAIRTDKLAKHVELRLSDRGQKIVAALRMGCYWLDQSTKDYLQSTVGRMSLLINHAHVWYDVAVCDSLYPPMAASWANIAKALLFHGWTDNGMFICPPIFGPQGISVLHSLAYTHVWSHKPPWLNLGPTDRGQGDGEKQVMLDCWKTAKWNKWESSESAPHDSPEVMCLHMECGLMLLFSCDLLGEGMIHI